MRDVRKYKVTLDLATVAKDIVRVQPCLGGPYSIVRPSCIQMVKAPQDAKVDAICPALDISAACSESRKDANDKDREKTKVVNDHLHPCCAALIQREQQMHGLIRLGRIHSLTVSNTRRWRLTSTR